LASATTQQDCQNQLAQCVTSTCTQAGCILQGTDCSCTSAQETQWDSLIASQCTVPYQSCLQSVSSGGSQPGSYTPSGGYEPSGGTGGGCCTGAYIILFAGLCGLLLARRF